MVLTRGIGDVFARQIGVKTIMVQRRSGKDDNIVHVIPGCVDYAGNVTEGNRGFAQYKNKAIYASLEYLFQTLTQIFCFEIIRVDFETLA